MLHRIWILPGDAALTQPWLMKRFLLLSMLALPISASADGGLPTQPYIYVEGKAEAEKVADMVTVTFELSALDPDQSAANKVVQEKAKKVFALAKSAAIADSDVEAGDLQSAAEYREDGEDREGKRELIGYRVTRPFKVSVREVGRFPKLVDDLLAIGVEEISGIEPGLSKGKELEDEVWDKALANARERAEKALQPARMKVDSIFAISPVAFPEIERRIFGGNSVVQMAQRSEAAPGAGAPSEYRLAPISVAQSVHVIYLISPAK